MKAIVIDKYGGPEVMKLREIEKPVPKPNEVLIKVRNTSLNAADWHFMRGTPYFMRLMFGVFHPKIRILGADIAGEVVDIGAEVKGFKIGDEVFGDIANYHLGGLAEYVTTSEEYIYKKPGNLSFEEAAAVPLAAITALQGLRDKGQLKKGEKVLIHGASGGVGTYAIQIAKYFGAEVTAVCSTGKVNLVKELGADQVIDYKTEDFTQVEEKFDLIFAINGNHSLRTYKKVMKEQGRYIMAGGTNKQIFQAVLLGKLYSRKRKKFGHVDARCNPEDLKFIKDLIDNNKLKPVIDRKYPLEKSREAMEYLYDGHAKGKIVITV